VGYTFLELVLRAEILPMIFFKSPETLPLLNEVKTALLEGLPYYSHEIKVIE